MQKKKNNNLKQFLVYGVILLVSVLLIYWFVSGNNKGTRITYSEFQVMVEQKQIAEVDIYGYTVRIRLVDSEIEEKDFPNKIDAYFTVMSPAAFEQYLIEHNNAILDEHKEDAYTTDENGNKVIKTDIGWRWLGRWILD